MIHPNERGIVRAADILRKMAKANKSDAERLAREFNEEC
jgi:hypothetical protein